ncbi:MAG TPA: carboxypeptidase regulatory-like domain-containing protein [Pyrinomonadaceae bacterium]|nr:carboxypeptidase regulatory-like domain-containing protein [Pyrinomonadaceae bacterium]
MKRLVAFFAVAALCTVALPHLLVKAQRQGTRLNRPELTQDVDLDRLVRRYERVSLDRAEAVGRVRARGELSFKTSAGTYELELEPNDMRADNYSAVEIGADGIERPVWMNGPVRTYKGSVRGMQGAQARFTVDDDTLEGVIITPAERYFIEPKRKYAAEAAESEFVFYKSSDVNADAAGVGGTLDRELRHQAEALSSKVQNLEAASLGVLPATTVRDVQLATDADAEYVAALGSSAAANAEILAIMNQVEGVYQTQLGLSFTVVHQNAWTNASTDPYTTNEPGGCYTAAMCGLAPGEALDPKGLINELGEWWKANKAGVQRDLTHLWTGKDVLGSTVGLAWMGVTCQSPSYAYGFSQRLTSLPGKYIVTAHEIGHNFGADHSDGKTGCSNTIMGSFIGTGFTFCPFSVGQITDHATAFSSCLTSCNISASPTTKSVAATAGQYNFSLTAGCAWNATSNQSWLTFAAGSASGTGSQTIVYNVAANAGASRTAIISVNGEKHTVTQAASAAPTSLSIKGKVTLGTSNLAGVTMKLTGSKVANVMTNSLGEYTFTGLTPGGSYTVTPWKLGYVFSNTSAAYANLTQSPTGVNFVARAQNNTIGGRVVRAGTTTGVAGITVGLTGSRTVSTTTDASGNYSFANLPAGGNYTVRPASTLNTFSPAYKTFTNLVANQSQQFTATLKTYSITGKITVAGTTTGIYQVAVTVTSPTAGFTARTVNTNTAGGYSLTGLPAGRSYVITPRKTGYAFTPASRSFTNLSANQPAGTATSFTGTN